MIRRKIVAAALVVIALLVGGVYYGLSARPTLHLTHAPYFNPHHAVFGTPLWEPTFENIMTRFATNVVIGRVKGTPQGNVQAGMFDLQVSEDLIGDIGENLIKVYADANALQVEQQYLLVLSKFASTAYPFDFYVVFHDFILQLDDAGGVSRLVNPVDGIFVRPFVEEKYNSLTELRAQIRALAHRNRRKDNPDSVVEKAPNLQALVAMSDHILHVELIEIHDGNPNEVVAAFFGVVKAYKGGVMPNVRALTLPVGVEVGKQYMVFLRNYEGAVTLATRQGSLLPKEDAQFGAVVAFLSRR